MCEKSQDKNMVFLYVSLILIAFLLVIKYPFAFVVKGQPRRLFVEYNVKGILKHRGFFFIEDFRSHAGDEKGEKEDSDNLLPYFLKYVEVESARLYLVLPFDNFALDIFGGSAFSMVANGVTGYILSRWKNAEVTTRVISDFDADANIIVKGKIHYRGISILIILFQIIANAIRAKIKKIKKNKENEQ